MFNGENFIKEQKMKILITGGCGFVGANLCLFLNKKKNRVGDHIWYVSDLKKFKKHFPKWKQKYNTKKIISELIEKNN